MQRWHDWRNARPQATPNQPVTNNTKVNKPGISRVNKPGISRVNSKDRNISNTKPSVVDDLLLDNEGLGVRMARAATTVRDYAVLSGTTIDTVSIDAEWDSYRDNLPLTVQVYFPQLDVTFITVNEDIEGYLVKHWHEPVNARLRAKHKSPQACWQRIVRRLYKVVNDETITLTASFTDGLSPLQTALEMFAYNGVPIKEPLDIVMFYSPKDLTLALGKETVLPAYMHTLPKQKTRKGYANSKGQITQKRNIKGKALKLGDYQYTIHDMKGWTTAGTGSLRALGLSVGVEMQAKDDIDAADKGRMLDVLALNPTKFLRYAAYDAVDLIPIRLAYQGLACDVARKTIGVDIKHTDIPPTVGAMVALIFKLWLHTQPGNPEAFEVALRKLGLLDVDVPRKDYNAALKSREVVERVRTPKAVADLVQGGDYALQVLKPRYKWTGYSQAGSQYFATVPNRCAFNALVQGGRCVNEAPEEYSVGLGADIDLDGCYGSALKDFTYPIGLPSTIGGSANQKYDTLGKFLKRYEPELVPGLWQVVVSGELSYDQDVIFSKDTTPNQLKRYGAGVLDDGEAANDERDNPAHIPGNFMLLKREILNGVITHDLWERVKAVASNKELKELLDLKLVSAAWYSAKDRVSSIDEWTEVVLKHTGRLCTKPGRGTVEVDERTRAWCGIPLEGFIGKLLERRKDTKRRKKTDINAAAEDTTLKLFVNTTYGTLASPFFPIGNTVLANNITARARVGAWMISKSLHTRQSITDGGFYDINTVPFISEGAKLPGLHKLAAPHGEWKRNRGTGIKPLGGLKDWAKVYDAWASKGERYPSYKGRTGKVLDRLAAEHIDTFWGMYGVTLPFNIEHKEGNTFYRAAYWSKAHYAFDTIWGKRTYKIRGARLYKRDNEQGPCGMTLKSHPTYELLDNILDGVDDFPEDLTYHHFYLLKIGAWRTYNTGKSRAADHPLEGKEPGDGVVSERTARYNNTAMGTSKHKVYQKRSGRRTSKVVDGQTFNIELFERYRHQGIAKVHAMMMVDRLA